MESNTVQYAPFSSSVDPSFWQTLTQKKLNEYGLDESPRTINGFYSNANAAGICPNVTLEYTAFNKDWKSPPRHMTMRGILYNTNTIEAFKEMDKKKLLNDVGKQMWDEMNSGPATFQPENLCKFVLLTFADLKKYHYYYWFAFPAFKFPERVTYSQPQRHLEEIYSTEKLSSLVDSYDTYQNSRPNFSTFFVILDNGDSFSLQDLSYLNQENIGQENVILGVCDPSSIPSYPGWPLRNLISLIAHKYAGHLKTLRVVCVRDRIYDGQREFGRSYLLTLDMSLVEKSDACPECVGWEKNERGKMGPRMVNLSSSMNPTRLAESAVDLNLRLMRWRLLPDLDLEKIGSTKCLLLGSGTLGCNVARLLMGWGMRHITMVDNSKVSYSNPVRQTLFTFQDCLDGGKPKAQAASDSLRNIFPGMMSEGISLSIPMPGHSVTESTLGDVKADVEKLEHLIASHDVVFLLMDTRESRWLPSVIAGAQGKIVINAALGFDSFLVLRHGLKTGSSTTTGSVGCEDAGKEDGGKPIHFGRLPGNVLGCYFCNDVVAPGNSTRDRTLDQQCTVTRPGVSMIAASLAVELLVSLLQHPKGGLAEANSNAGDDPFAEDTESSLGMVPHQIRGFLSRFQQILPATRAFDMCTGCSSKILDQYKQEGFDFLVRAFNETGYLEELTGLASMQDASLCAEVWDLSDDDFGDDGPSSMETA